jgi:hypothetical protein
MAQSTWCALDDRGSQAGSAMGHKAQNGQLSSPLTGGSAQVVPLAAATGTGRGRR